MDDTLLTLIIPGPDKSNYLGEQLRDLTNSRYARRNPSADAGYPSLSSPSYKGTRTVVVDTSIGISPRHYYRMFEKREQLDADGSSLHTTSPDGQKAGGGILHITLSKYTYCLIACLN